MMGRPVHQHGFHSVTQNKYQVFAGTSNYFSRPFVVSWQCLHLKQTAFVNNQKVLKHYIGAQCCKKSYYQLQIDSSVQCIQ